MYMTCIICEIIFYCSFVIKIELNTDYTCVHILKSTTDRVINNYTGIFCLDFDYSIAITCYYSSSTFVSIGFFNDVSKINLLQDMKNVHYIYNEKVIMSNDVRNHKF